MQLIYTIFGYVGSGILSLLFIPQVYTTYKTKNVLGLSLTFLILNFIVCCCWIVYSIGFFLDNDLFNFFIIVGANSSILISNGMLIIAHLKYSRNKEKVEEEKKWYFFREKMILFWGII